MKGSNTGRIRLLLDYVLCFLLIIFFNLTVFHTGLYQYICKPESYAGYVYGRLKVLEKVEKRSSELPVAIMGDSTIEDGIGAAQLSRITGKPVVNIAMPATGPMVWHHYFQSIDPDRNRFETLVLMVTPQDVETEPHNEGIQSLMAVSPPHILWNYFKAFQDPWENLSHYYASLDRVYAFRNDLRDLVLSPERWTKSGQLRKKHLQKLEEWPLQRDDVCSVRVDLNAYKVTHWGSVHDREIRQVVNRTLRRTRLLNDSPRVVGIVEWVEEILEYYEGSKTKILVVTFPFGWNHKVNPGHPVLENYFAQMQRLASLSDVAHWDATSLPLFQSCQNYYDFRHLNALGREQFTTELGTVLNTNAF